MKKLVFILLFIPLISFGQSYKDLMSISSVEMFKKVAIENGYEYDSTDDDWVTYGFNITKDSIEGNKSAKWLNYNQIDERFTLKFSRDDVLASLLGALLESSTQTEGDTSENPYDLIVKDIKEKCKYYKIQNYKGTDYVTYSCSDSSYKGKIGFVIEEGRGIIRHFPQD
jgi:hypothetical protein